MEYEKMITLKDGRTCILRNAVAEDAEAVLTNFFLTHSQTDYLASYPGENVLALSTEKVYLQKIAESDRDVQLVAKVDGIIVGSAGVNSIKQVEKMKHRAFFGISIDQAFWGLGIGRAMMESCIECAKKMGYVQLELEVVADNNRACALYHSAGFVEYGRNPKGFRSRLNGWQELVLMRKELTE